MPQYMVLINNILTTPGTTFKAELQQQIATIHAVIAFCPIEEGPLTQHILF